MNEKPTYEELERQVKALTKKISEINQAGEILNKSETRYKAIVESSPMGMHFYELKDDNSLIFIGANAAADRLLGVDNSIFIGKTIEEAFPPLIQTEIPFQYRKVATKRETWSTEEIIYEDEKIKGAFDVCVFQTEPNKIVAMFSDITHRKRAEKALQQSELLLNSTQEITKVGGWEWDAQYQTMFWTRETYRIHGFKPEEIEPGSIKHIERSIECYNEKDRPAIIEAFQKCSTEGKPYDMELPFTTINNKKIWIRTTARAIKENGKIVRVIGNITDITERKEAEEEKRKALEFSAEQSKLSLIGQVAGKMAHDFNNILMGIMGNAQLAVMECYDRQIKEKLERIVEYSERGRDITNNLISYSKDQEPKQTYFKIEDKIDLILKMYEKELKDIEVSRNYKPGIPKLLADPGMIQDVLANLLQNSIHAMSLVEMPRLKLKTYSQDDKVYFEIEDNGCGIPKEHQDSIFTPSFTLKGSHDKTGSYKLGIKGTGYGMSNVKKYIVEKHKGNISLESEPGKGTKITIALKIIKNQLSPDEKKEVLKSQIFDKRRILLVEDEAAIADVQYQLLTKEPFNHVVSTAANGLMAIDVFDRNRFDVVSLDYLLPGDINGLDVYNHIRKNDGNIPVLFISGNIEFLESMKKLKEKDPNLEHLSKPVSNLEYVNKINELIGRTIKKKI